MNTQKLVLFTIAVTLLLFASRSPSKLASVFFWLICLMTTCFLAQDFPGLSCTFPTAALFPVELDLEINIWLLVVHGSQI